MKIVILVLLAAVLIALFSGLYFMYKDKGQTNRTAVALTVRVAVSACIIVVFIVCYFMGWLPSKR
jgi:cytochrome bd-type quinol oxidase subunit 2